MLEATYTKPYMAHASIGPSAAVAEFKDGKFTVWTHSQGVFPLRGELAKALKVAAGGDALHPCRRLGLLRPQRRRRRGARRRAAGARGAGRPVRLQWMRDDEFAWEPYGAGDGDAGARRRSTPTGRIVDWKYEVWSNSHSTRPHVDHGRERARRLVSGRAAQMGPPTSPPQPAGGGDRNAIPLYDFPNQKVVHHFIQDMPIRMSALRTLGAYANVFAAESFMDELALAAGADPVAFRLAHLKDPRAPRRDREGRRRRPAGRRARRATARAGAASAFSKYKNLACYVRGGRRRRGRSRERARARDRAPVRRPMPG